MPVARERERKRGGADCINKKRCSSVKDSTKKGKELLLVVKHTQGASVTVYTTLMDVGGIIHINNLEPLKRLGMRS
jgi:hypothetical protein